ERFADLLVFPVVGLVLWGFVANYVRIQSSVLASFFLGGMILWIIFERVGSSIGIDFMWEVWEKNLINILATPISIVEYLVGLVLVSIIKVIISFAGMWILASAFYHFQIGSLGFALVAFWINLILFAVTLGIFNVAIIARFGHSIGPLTWILPFAIQPFAAVFYPVSILPVAFQTIVWFLPISHVFEGMRNSFSTGTFGWGDFWAAFILNIVYFCVTVVFFGLMLRFAKKNGSLVKL
ncbi:MAG: ABC transporter permease, partial [Candidatus Magasanikbacteria bacterium]|nr:ABC transporter permease [Candidatus Magasanikbacteria bacterium]